jgi:hypothetical protein
LLVAAACYHPSAATGVPCGNGDACPSGQHCDTGQSPPVCVAHLTDASSPDVPAADAAPACATSDDCGSDAPICDHGACRRCVADDECTGGVCTEYSGACVAEALAVFVAPAPAGMDAGTCTRAQPCATFAYALGQVSSTREVIAIGPGSYSVPGAQVITVNTRNGPVTQPLVISGPSVDPTQVMLDNAGGSAAADVIYASSQSQQLVIEGLTVTGPGEGMHIDAPVILSHVAVEHMGGAGVVSSPPMMGGTPAGTSMHVWDSRIEDSAGVGLIAQANGLEVLRSVVIGNTGGGVQTQRSALSIASSIIVANGTGTGAVGGIRMLNSNGLTGSLAFDTIADNQASSGNVVGVSADGPVTMIDTIHVNNGSGALCATCSATYSLFPAGTPAPPGVGNLAGDPAFVNQASGDYHILPSSAAHDMGHPASAVDYDVDGQPRPQGAYDIGADEIP